MASVKKIAPITTRTFEFSVRVVRLCRELQTDEVGRTLSRQLLRSGTSIGANVHEAQGGQTKADFIAKMSVAHKEALDTAYWLRLMTQAGLLSGERGSELLDETEQLSRILSRILIRSKARKAARR